MYVTSICISVSVFAFQDLTRDKNPKTVCKSLKERGLGMINAIPSSVLQVHPGPWFSSQNEYFWKWTTDYFNLEFSW